jgi:ATP-binding cassette subfamily B protein
VVRSYDERVKIVQESLGGIRDVIVDNNQAAYLHQFEAVDSNLSAARASTNFISGSPRFVIESLGMVAIAGLALVMSQRQGGLAAALPILGAIALGTQRVLPLIQQIYNGWSLAAGSVSAVSEVLALLRLPVDRDSLSRSKVKPLPLRDRIVLDQVSFAYPTRRGRALSEVTIEIPRGSMIALTGPTGSGKSTLADLLMGLVDPDEGRVLIDGTPLTSRNRRRWQRSIGHVPQAIFLSDSSIASNIAFGVPKAKLDLERVADAARKAQIDDFIRSLPDGYHTPVGDRGVRLSGGQRQRLGIARAIYKDAPVLVLDEATSALDDETEAAVIATMEQLRAEGRTIVVIAHRASTISRCDHAVRLQNGRLVESAETPVRKARARKTG